MNLHDFRKKDLYLLVFGGVVLHWSLNYLEQFFDLISFILGAASPFFLGIGIAFLLNLPMRAIENGLRNLKKRLHILLDKTETGLRPLSICLTLIIVGGAISGTIAIVVPKITETISVLNRQIPQFLDGLQTMDSESPWLKESIQWLALLGMDLAEFSAFLAEGLGALSDIIWEHSLGLATQVFDKAVTFGIAFVLAIYLLSGKERLAQTTKKVITVIFSPVAARRIKEHIRLIDDTFATFFRGQCLEACILGAMFFVGMSILRFPNALLISILVSITALIPVFGAFIACVVGAFLMLVQSPMLAIWFVVFFLVMQQIEGNLIYPHVMGSRIGLPSAWVLVAVTLGGSLFGILGMVLFIPIFSIFYTLIRQQFNTWYNQKISSSENKITTDGSGNQ